MNTIEKRLKDYKGYQLWKVIDNKGLKNEKITYMINDHAGNNCNCKSTLPEAKEWIREHGYC